MKKHRAMASSVKPLERRNSISLGESANIAVQRTAAASVRDSAALGGSAVALVPRTRPHLGVDLARSKRPPNAAAFAILGSHGHPPAAPPGQLRGIWRSWPFIDQPRG